MDSLEIPIAVQVFREAPEAEPFAYFVWVNGKRVGGDFLAFPFIPMNGEN